MEDFAIQMSYGLASPVEICLVSCHPLLGSNKPPLSCEIELLRFSITCELLNLNLHQRMRFLLPSIKFPAVSDYCRQRLEKPADSQTNMVRKYGSSLRWRVVFLHDSSSLSRGDSSLVESRKNICS